MAEKPCMGIKVLTGCFQDICARGSHMKIERIQITSPSDKKSNHKEHCSDRKGFDRERVCKLVGCWQPWRNVAVIFSAFGILVVLVSTPNPSHNASLQPYAQLASFS